MQIKQASLNRITIRWMLTCDYKDVIAIENDSFDYPWSFDELIRSLRRPANIGRVIEYNGRVVGFIIYELTARRFNILNLAVDGEFRQMKFGKMLVKTLIDKLTINRRKFIATCVCESNLRAQLFFRSIGFRAVGILKNYYRYTDETAYCFVYRVCGEDLKIESLGWDGCRDGA